MKLHYDTCNAQSEKVANSAICLVFNFAHLSANQERSPRLTSVRPLKVSDHLTFSSRKVNFIYFSTLGLFSTQILLQLYSPSLITNISLNISI